MVILGFLALSGIARFISLRTISEANAEEYIINSVQTGIVIQHLKDLL